MESSLSKADQRRADAIKWTDKEIRKLIREIQTHGAPSGSGGIWEVAFGKLFVETANCMEALSGTLRTSKKMGVVAFDGDLLLQRVHDHIIIRFAFFILLFVFDEPAFDAYFMYTRARVCACAVILSLPLCQTT